jgi:DNA processing protein
MGFDMTGATESTHERRLPLEAYLVALASLSQIGPARLRWVLSVGTPQCAWEAVARGRLPPAPASLRVGRELRQRWQHESRSIEPGGCWDRCRELGIGVLSLGSPGYPAALAADPEPPVVLFHLGDPEVLQHPAVAVVGTRRPTGYGLRTAESLGHELALNGVSVVSGLALGIDAAAHRGAIISDSTPPVAVVGSGLDSPCPARNRSLARQVARQGLLISEVPPGVPAAPWRFPVRNRIIAALAGVVVVVESSVRGGSMHTVREALTRDRPVLAVPGPVDSPASAGTNFLLAEGAHPCLSADDLLSAAGLPGGSAHQQQRDTRARPTGDAARVLEQLGWGPTSPTSLARRAGVDFSELAGALAELERNGWIQLADGWVERLGSEHGPSPGPAGTHA